MYSSFNFMRFLYSYFKTLLFGDVLRVHHGCGRRRLRTVLAMTHPGILKIQCNLSYRFCMDFNKMMLKKQGLEEEDIQKMEADPSKSLLEEKEAAMLTFVVKAVKDPTSVSAKAIQQLKAMGWEDKDLVDALAHGVNMIDHSIMMQVFQVDQDCTVG